jgi:hypothetical protein
MFFVTKPENQTLLSDEETEELYAATPTDVDYESLIPAGFVPEVLPNRQSKYVITIDKEHAYPILDNLMEAYTSNASPYNLDRVRVPQDPRHMPKTLERGSVDHAMFLFNVCYYMRGGIKSNDAVKRMSAIYDAHPELFNADFARTFDSNELQAILKENGLGFQATVANQWIENSRR